MKRLWIAGLLMFSGAGAALGSDWTILVMQNQTCVPATTFAKEQNSAAFLTPYALRKFMRDNVPTYSGTKVWNAPNGMGRMVEIGAGGREVYYFSNQAFCREAIKIDRANGTLPNLNELR